MKCTGKVKDIVLDIETRKPVISIMLDEKKVPVEFNELMDLECLDIELKKHRNKRSLSANAYAWMLMDRLAETLLIQKELVYKNIVRNIGGNATYLKVRTDACEKFIEEWGKKGLGWCGEVIDTDGEFSDVVVYYGSSTYDTKQMSRLIELVIQECQMYDIPTETLERAAYWEGLLNQ